MLDYQERVVKEKKDLDKKIHALIGALLGFNIVLDDEKERDRMVSQFYSMFEYSETLRNRIKNFKQ